MIQVPLASVTMGWPDAIRQVLAGLNTPDAIVMLPASELEQCLKKGKVVFQWKRIKSFVKPPLKSGLPPAVEESQVEFPLQIIAPLFLAQRKPATQQKKFEVAEDIPDVFSGKGLIVPPAEAPDRPAVPAPSRPAPPPAAPAPAPARPAPAAAPARPAPAPAPVRAPARPAPAPAPLPAAATEAMEIGEIFGQPGRKNWSPAELVERSSGLRGVVGAIIAMPDGLLVASHLPPGLNGEAVAAFLPQMFTRMMQYCKELKFGDATRLTLVVDNVPLKIVKVGGVYFAALGRAEEPLPDAQLNVIAAHLAPQSK
jgi:predicted regulator of Ras-like GTPase activity (Roadblock/LC7/MglB family)